MGTLRPAKAERAPREQVTATELGNRPAFPCALPFEHPDKCGMSLSIGRYRLYDEIARNGVIMSESPPGRRPFRWTFPARNRIMAALSAMTVVVEASDPSPSASEPDSA